MFFNKVNKVDQMFNKLCEYYNSEPNPKTDKKIFELSTNITELDPTHFTAMFILGECYAIGIHVEKDYKKAVEIFKKLENNPDSKTNPDYQFRYACALEDIGDCGCLLKYLRCSQLDSPRTTYATYRIGDIFLNSDIIKYTPYPQRIEIAKKYLSKASLMKEDAESASLARDALAILSAKEERIIPLEIEKESNIANLLSSSI